MSPSLLITDDDRAFRETLREVFASRGFATHLAADGEEAVTIVRRERIHLALLDMHMPRLTGLETMAAVRELDDSLPCILISGGLDPVIRQQAQEAKAFDVLEKPIRLNQVREAVATAFAECYDWTL